MIKIRKKTLITKEGLDKLKEELINITKVKRPQATQRVARAREFGDLSENSEYDAAKDELSLIDIRISELKELLKDVELIKQKPRTDFAVIGSTVIVNIDGEIDEFTIVGSIEADPANKKISNESPVGQALLGAKVGEEIWVTTPVVRARYRILEIK
jgi:transcription elongation factor GreA